MIKDRAPKEPIRPPKGTPINDVANPVPEEAAPTNQTGFSEYI